MQKITRVIPLNDEEKAAISDLKKAKDDAWEAYYKTKVTYNNALKNLAENHEVADGIKGLSSIFDRYDIVDGCLVVGWP